jgi:hypothetical protein
LENISLHPHWFDVKPRENPVVRRPGLSPSVSKVERSVAAAVSPGILIVDDVPASAEVIEKVLTSPVDGEELLARVRVHLRIADTNRVIRARAPGSNGRVSRCATGDPGAARRLSRASFEVFDKAPDEAGGDFYDVITAGSGVFGYFVADMSRHCVRVAFLYLPHEGSAPSKPGPAFSPEDTMHGIDGVMPQMPGEEQCSGDDFSLYTDRLRCTAGQTQHRRQLAAPRNRCVAVKSEPVEWRSQPRATVDVIEQFLPGSSALVRSRPSGTRSIFQRTVAARGTHQLGTERCRPGQLKKISCLLGRPEASS